MELGPCPSFHHEMGCGQVWPKNSVTLRNKPATTKTNQ
jgi:hypothetical protein